MPDLPSQDVPSLPVELLYRDGRMRVADLTGWTESGPRLAGAEVLEGLLCLRFPAPAPQLRHDGVGRVEDWKVPDNVRAEPVEEGGMLFHFDHRLVGRLQRELPALPDRFRIRVRLRRPHMEALQLHFFVPAKGHSVPATLGIGMGRNVNISHSGEQTRRWREVDYVAPVWGSGLMEVEVFGDRTQSMLAVRVNQGAVKSWTVEEGTFPVAEGMGLRIQMLSGVGAVHLQRLQILEWNGVLPEAVAGPFPLWEFRNGDRISAGVAGWEGLGVTLKTADGGRIAVPVTLLQTLWLSGGVDAAPPAP
jgi:hypothetical protein